MKYSWKRFWCPRNGKINLSDGGFLCDPENKYATRVQSDVVPFDAISARPCLALLGEPGIGKSTAMGEMKTTLQESLESSGDDLLYVNLNEYGDETRLIQDLFGSREFVAWKAGNHVLHLFLDSLDECRIRIPQVATILIRQFQRIEDHLKRLRLRIACRTADWPRVLENHLPTLWPAEGFGAYELAPLRRRDVWIAADAEGIDGVTFIEALSKAEVISLAIKPVTLHFLLGIFSESAALPTTRTDLYERGCELLCEEQNPNRQDLRRMGGAGILSARERLNVASRIAAISIFCQKPIIRVGSSTHARSADETMISELANQMHKDAVATEVVSEDDIRETLGTGLFSSRGPELMGFAHETYGEFLAARYLELRNVSCDRRLAILQHHGDFEVRIAPQLYQTAAWVASHDTTVFDQIAAYEPQVLLRCDEGALNSQQRSQLLDEFLKALDEGRTNDRDWDLHRHYPKLSYTGLAAELRPWIGDPGRDPSARNAAVDIAEACGVSDLQGVLADVALNESEQARLRGNAAHALASVGNRDTRSRLRPLAFGGTGEDPLDDLKGNALRAVWPDVVTADELLAHLTLPKRQNYFGAYCSFVNHEFCERLSADDLPSALRWLETHAAERQPLFAFNEMANAMIVLAWKGMDDPQVLQALAGTAIALLKQHHELVDSKETREECASLFDNVGKRRTLTEAILQRGIDTHVVFGLLGAGTSLRIVRDSDLPWCVEQLLNSISQPAEPIWANLVWTLFSCMDPSSEAVDLIIEARAKSAELARESEASFTPVALASEAAQRMKGQYERIQKWQQPKEPKLLEWLPKDRIQHWLAQFEAGEQRAWWRLLREMTLEDTSESYEHLFAPDVTSLPGWRNSGDNTRQRILSAAEAYLNTQNPFNSARLLDGAADEEDIAPYKAFVLLLKERSDQLEKLSEEMWAYWTPVLLGPFGFDGTQDIQKLLIRVAYQKVPGQVMQVLQQMIRHQIHKDDCYISVSELVEDSWDQRIADGVRGLLDEAEAKPLCWARILAVLLAHADSQARLQAQAKLSLPLPQGKSDREIALHAALVLIDSEDDAAWAIIWPLLQREADFGRDLIVDVAHSLHHDYAKFFVKLSEDQLADLFIWLVGLFPPSRDPDENNEDQRGKEDDVRYMRTAIINALEKAGTPASCQAIDRVANALPQLDWLKSVLVEARQNTVRATWRPLKPEEFLEITSRPAAALVRDTTELQDVLVEALRALQGVLQGETPATPDLWDERDRGRFRPKDENHFSDWVKRNLESELNRRGIVVAREVQIRRGEGSAVGERTDIHVTAVIPGRAPADFEQVRVIIEAKGCWHRELKSAMGTQLVGRYLKDNQCQHGIYLVGWYDCDQWDDEDSRKTQTPEWTLEKAQAFFTEQAQEFSGSTRSIQAVVLNTALR